MRATPKAAVAQRVLVQSEELRKKCLLPPWIRYPCQPPMSLFWRMGGGESYLTTFWGWLGSLKPASREEYTRLFVPPRYWLRAYDDGPDKGDDPSEGAPTQELQCAAKLGVTLWTPTGRTTLTREDLLAEQAQGTAPTRSFYFFYGHTQSTPKLTKACFSQFWTRPGSRAGQPLFEEASWSYVCAEQYMMHNKALVFGDDETADEILAQTDPFKIKALGRQVKGFDADKWNVVARSIVCQGNYYKFSANEDLRQFLLNTGDAVLVEASARDCIWGIGCALPKTPEATEKLSDVSAWNGDNWLGFALMDVRDEIRRVYANVSVATEAA